MASVTDEKFLREQILVKVLEIDRQGKIRLSRKDAMAEQADKGSAHLLSLPESQRVYKKIILDNGVRVVLERMSFEIRGLRYGPQWEVGTKEKRGWPLPFH